MKSTAVLPVLIQYGLILVMVAAAVVLVLLGVWLRAHQKQVDAQLGHIQDTNLRNKATEVVRWLEQDPDQMYKSGLAQRSTGIGMLVSLLGASTPAATVAIDAAFQALSLAGQIIHHDPPVEAAAPASGIDYGEIAGIVGKEIAAALAQASTSPAASTPASSASLTGGSVSVPPASRVTIAPGEPTVVQPAEVATA